MEYVPTMSFQVQTALRQSCGRDLIVYELTAGSASAEIWPSHGFNCLHWRVAAASGPADLLYVAPDWETNPIPTRSGIPVLFPFPNRIRQGRFHFAGRDYQLHLNDSSGKNAIHGFAPRHPWRVVETGVGEDSVFIRGEFQASIDAPDCRMLWPADYKLSLTYRLSATTLRAEVIVQNVDARKRLPFGFGLHPYFQVPRGEERDITNNWVEARTAALWILEDSLPTGERSAIPPGLDFRTPRHIGEQVIDALYSDKGEAVDLRMMARMGNGGMPGILEIWISPEFRELLLFTPPHRRALCLEPYTCATDAANLWMHQIDSGWRILEPGQSQTALCEFRWRADAPPPLGMYTPPEVAGND